MSYIYQKVTLSRFRDAFQAMGREKQFSREALEVIYDHLVEMAEDCGTPQEMDVIAICCDFAEYASIAEYNAEYGEDAEYWGDVEALIGETPSGSGVININM